MYEVRVCQKSLLGMAGDVVDAQAFSDRTEAVTRALYLYTQATGPCVIQVVNTSNGYVEFKRVS